MKKIIVALLLIFNTAINGFCEPFTSTSNGIQQAFFTTTGVVANGVGTTIRIEGVHAENWGIIAVRTAGATDTVEIDLECSIDGTNFVQMNTITSVAGGSNSAVNANRTCYYFRYNVVTVGVGNTLTITITAKEPT